MARRKTQQRFKPGAQVLVGFGRQPATVLQVDDAPSVMGEYAHIVRTNNGDRKVLGSELELVPEPMTNVPNENSREKPGTVNIYNLHGSHSRVNIQSEDRSVNVSSITEQEVFSGIREAVTQKVSEGDERKTILEKLDALERSVHSHDFLSKYKDFINTVASHLTIVAPFLPALSQMLGN